MIDYSRLQLILTSLIIINTLTAEPAVPAVYQSRDNEFDSLLSSHERDIQKPSAKGSKYRKSAYIEYFLQKVKPDLKIQLSDSLLVRDQKTLNIQTFVSQLNSYSKTSVMQLKSKLDALNLYGEKLRWKVIPSHLKSEAVNHLELMAKRSNLPLDKCTENWAAKTLISTSYHNYIRAFMVCYLAFGLA